MMKGSGREYLNPEQLDKKFALRQLQQAKLQSCPPPMVALILDLGDTIVISLRAAHQFKQQRFSVSQPGFLAARRFIETAFLQECVRDKDVILFPVN